MTTSRSKRAASWTLGFVFSQRTFWVTFGVLAVILVVGFAFNVGRLFAPRPKFPYPVGPDGTTFLSTLIAIYALFLGVYGVLIPQLADATKPRRQDGVEGTIIVVTIGVVLLDLVRIVNSVGDLYDTSTRYLSTAALDDARFEFVWFWFPGNAVVVGLGLYGLMRLHVTYAEGQAIQTGVSSVAVGQDASGDLGEPGSVAGPG